jgi:hypothetical protein
MPNHKMSIDFDRGVWIVTCSCGNWRLETSPAADERVLEVFWRIDSAFARHQQEMMDQTDRNRESFAHEEHPSAVGKT